MVVNEPPAPEKQSAMTEDADTPARRQASAKQIEANRRNALQSTGPKTLKGKQVSRLNALTHGLRAKEVVIAGQEDPAEFEAILRELREDWQPQGHTQTHLVEQIGLAEWRLRRVPRAELGEIRTQMAMLTASESDTQAEIERAFEHPPERVPQILKRSTAGISYLREVVEAVLVELESEGEVSEETCQALDLVFGGNPDSLGTIFRDWFLEDRPDWYEEEENSDGEPTPRADKSEPDKKVTARKKLDVPKLLKIAARKLLKKRLNDLDRQERKLRKRERTDLEIAQQRLSIPMGPELEQIQRYETSIKREMYRAIDQLERLQRRRRGEPPPPTVNVKVSNDD